MGSVLRVTVLPNFVEFRSWVGRASARMMVQAAHNSGYGGELGEFVQATFGEAAFWDDAAMDVIATDSDAVNLLRGAAYAAAGYVERERALTLTYSRTVCDGTRNGGPDVLVVGGVSAGDGPFDGFEDVELLAALLALEPTSAVTSPH